jgi:hypothetical protein
MNRRQFERHPLCPSAGEDEIFFVLSDKTTTFAASKQPTMENSLLPVIFLLPVPFFLGTSSPKANPFYKKPTPLILHPPREGLEVRLPA